MDYQDEIEAEKLTLEEMAAAARSRDDNAAASVPLGGAPAADSVALMRSSVGGVMVTSMAKGLLEQAESKEKAAIAIKQRRLGLGHAPFMSASTPA